MLFAVAATSTAVADPKPEPMQPRTLQTGAPACGNVSYKSIESPVCKTARVILTAVAQDVEQIRRLLAVFDGSELLAKEPLTLAEGARPRS